MRYFLWTFVLIQQPTFFKFFNGVFCFWLCRYCYLKQSVFVCVCLELVACMLGGPILWWTGAALTLTVISTPSPPDHHPQTSSGTETLALISIICSVVDPDQEIFPGSGSWIICSGSCKNERADNYNFNSNFLCVKILDCTLYSSTYCRTVVWNKNWQINLDSSFKLTIRCLFNFHICLHLK